MRHQLRLFEPEFQIADWSSLYNLPKSNHESVYLDILKKHNFGKLLIPIPLKKRYTKGRRWSSYEFESCFEAWKSGTSLTLIAASLNRNPQDIIYKLLDRCKQDGLTFTQKGRTESTKNWNNKVKACAEELFEHGLPAWKIAVIFQVEFEHIEKELFLNRKGYGHNKKNPFTINTDHKQLVNETVIKNISNKGLSVLEAFAGEGRFTKILQDSDNIADITCIEIDKKTFENLKENVGDKKTTVLNKDNLDIFKQGNLKKFDIIDLDPFVTCHEQLDYVWQTLKSESFLFITFGGEYRRSFIKTNRLSIHKRYDFLDMDSENSDYLEIIPYYFLGYVAKKAAENRFEFEIIRAIRYANNCRFWLKTKTGEHPALWLENCTSENEKGIFYRNLEIPRFREIRKEIDNAKKMGFRR